MVRLNYLCEVNYLILNFYSNDRVVAILCYERKIIFMLILWLTLYEDILYLDAVMDAYLYMNPFCILCETSINEVEWCFFYQSEMELLYMKHSQYC